MANNDVRHSSLESKQLRRPPRRKVVDLSFEEHTTIGEWIYNHTIAIAVVLVALFTLFFALFFLTFDVEKHNIEYIVELAPAEDVPTPEQLQELAKEKERLEQEIREQLRQQVRNVQSNEASQSEGGMPSEVFDEETTDMMSRVDGILHSEEPLSGGSKTPSKDGSGGEGQGTGGSKGDGQDKNFKGAVTVEYKFENPTRTARGELYTPAYRAEHSGTVVIEVHINRNGEVIRTKVLRSSGIRRLDNEALDAAHHKRTIFNIDSSAPELHRGTITYTFIAQ